jgi:hypothetical protein
MQKWLARRSAAESLLNLLGSAIFLAFGLVALVLTSVAGAALVFLVLISANAGLAFFGLAISVMRPDFFASLVVVFLALTIFHAYVTRADLDAPANFDLAIGFGLIWEIISAGPVLLVMAGQEFHRYLRLSRLDVPHVSTLLLWIYDKGGRAGFAEICFAFPELNAVRVLPQLRDLPGINWWPQDAEISLSEALMQTLVETLHREPKSHPFTHTYTNERHHYQKPVVEVDQDIRSWYATLNLPLFANLQDVKKRYRKLAKIYHPDVHSAGSAASRISNDDQMKRINEAYHNILRNSQSKAGATQ